MHRYTCILFSFYYICKRLLFSNHIRTQCNGFRRICFAFKCLLIYKKAFQITNWVKDWMIYVLARSKLLLMNTNQNSLHPQICRHNFQGSCSQPRYVYIYMKATRTNAISNKYVSHVLWSLFYSLPLDIHNTV